MSGNQQACPTCGSAAARKAGYGRGGGQRFRCGDCQCRFTATTGTPFVGYRCPPDVIALAVRWYRRFWLSDADVAELLAERGVRVDPSSVYAWVQAFAPRYEAAARAFRRAVGERWSVDETYSKVAGVWAYVYRAIDERGQVIDVYASTQRAGTGAAACFRWAIATTGVVPTDVTTDCAAACPPALSDVLPAALHETGKPVQQRIARDRQGTALSNARLQGPARGTRPVCRACLPA